MDSKALRLGVTCIALLGLAACGGNTPVRPMLMDSGPGGSDSGTPGPVDSGPRDSGMMGGMCVVGTATTMDLLPLVDACVPRCSSATLTTVNACMDGTCINNALEADTTPGIPWTVNGMAQPNPLDCGTCFGYQQLSCALDACPAETTTYLQCDPMADADMCNGEVMALETCLGGTGAAVFNPCANTQIGRCFPGGGGAAGFFPGAAPAAIETMPWSSIDPDTLAMFRAINL